MKIDAILWDYDGTIVNSVQKNIDITKRILSEIAPRLTGENLPSCLTSPELYHKANHVSVNWQDLYLNFYGLTEEEMYDAGALWTPYQLDNSIPVSLFDKVSETINEIEIPQAVCSQNTSKIIHQVLHEHELHNNFKTIIGYDDVPMHVQKPHAFGGIKCLKEIFEGDYRKNIIYIGDHEVDVEFSRNMAKEIGNQHQVISILVKYSGANASNWDLKPDYEIDSPVELLQILKSI